MKGSIAVISVPVKDQEKAKHFYQHTLGFDLVDDNPWGKGQRWVSLAPSGDGPVVSLVTWFERMPPGSVQGLVLAVEDLERARGDLLENGVDVSPVEAQPSGRFAMFSDPDGNGWILNEAP